MLLLPILVAAVSDRNVTGTLAVSPNTVWHRLDAVWAARTVLTFLRSAAVIALHLSLIRKNGVCSPL